MSSSVFYKFKSQKEPTRVEFDGTGISVFELKREIIVKSGLGDGSDFDLSIFDEDGKDEHEDDTEIIPRSTTVIARRLPAIKRGHGKAARYMTGKVPIHAKNQSRKEQAGKTSTKSASTTNPMAPMDQNMSEEDRMAAMFAAQSENWSAQKEELSKQTRIQIGGPRKGVAAPDHEPPDGYVCYRCGNKGHWIQNCPTNDDPDFEGKRRFKRATGIPKSFMKTIEKPVDVDSEDGEKAELPPNVMLTADGDHVLIMPDQASWEKFQAKTKSSAAAQEAAALGDKELRDRGLECPIDKKLFLDPMKTPCCEKTYCNDCITNALIESDFICPGCQEVALIDDLKPDEEAAKNIKSYLAEKDATKTDKERSKSPQVISEVKAVVDTKKKSPTPQPPTTLKGTSPTPVATSKSPQSQKSTPSLEQVEASKKRPADEVLENPKIPKGPKAMQQKQQQQQQQIPQMPPNMMNGMNNFQGMPFGNMPQNFFPGNGFNMPNPMMPFPMPGMPNPMMNNPFMMGSGYNGMSMNNMNMFNGGPQNNFGNGMGNMGGMMNNGMGMGMGRGNGNMPNGQGGGGMGNHNGQFANQQKNAFAEAIPSQEDNAYFRQPVNPHRHQGRQRRARPSDYREL